MVVFRQTHHQAEEQMMKESRDGAPGEGQLECNNVNMDQDGGNAAGGEVDQNQTFY